MSAPLLRLRDVSFGYGAAPVVEGLDLEIRRGDFLGVIGPNGTGKTTLLRGLLGLLPPLSGEVTRPAGPVRFGYVRQRQPVDAIFPLTAWEIVLMGRHGRIGPLRRPSAEDGRAARDALEAVDGAELADRLHRELSGGQAQRVLLARALASEPDVLVLDEPTNDLDLPSEAKLLRLVEDVRRDRGLSVVLVSHLLHVVLAGARTLALVRDGRVRCGPVAELASSQSLSDFYGTAVRVVEVEGRRTVVVPLSGVDAS